MYRIYHGLHGYIDCADKSEVADCVSRLLLAGLTNILVTRADVDVTGWDDYDRHSDGRIGTIHLEIPIVAG